MTDDTNAAASPQAQGTAAPSNSAGQASEITSDDQDDGQDDGGEGESGAENQPKKDAQPDRKQARLDRRIGELTWRAKQSERENAELKARLAEIEKRTAPKAPEKPRAEDFKTNDEFVEAMADWKLERKLEERAARPTDTGGKNQNQKTGNEITPEVRDAYNKAEASFADTVPDYDDAIEDLTMALPKNDIHTAVLINATLRHSMGPQLNYHLAKNQDVLDSILSLHPARIPARVEKLAATLKTQAAPKQQQLPNPPTSLKSGGASTPDSQLSGRELRKKHGVL